VSILKVYPDGSVTTYYPEVGVPAFHPSGDLYLANPTLASVGEIWKITPEGAMSTFATGFQHPRGLVFDSSNNLFVTDKYAGIIYKISPIPSRPSIDYILYFFDISIDEGTIEGRDREPCLADYRLRSMREMLETAKCLLEAEEMKAACKMLENVLKHCDGEPKPKDSIEGEDVQELAELVTELMDHLECN
jgi:hypothetical protein